MVILGDERLTRRRDADCIRVIAERIAKRWESDSPSHRLSVDHDAIDRLLVWAESALIRMAAQAPTRDPDGYEQAVALELTTHDLNDVLIWLLSSLLSEQADPPTSAPKLRVIA